MVLVSDFDKTLYDKNYEKNIKAVNEFVKKDNIFIIATGRSISSLKQIIKDDLKFSYIICNDGGMIFDSNFNLIYRKDIIGKYIEPIFKEIKKSIFFGNPLTDLGYAYRSSIQKNANSIIARVISYEKALIFKQKLIKKYPKINAYISDSYFIVTDKTVNKAGALKFLSKLLKINPKKMYIIGDNINDIKMCKLGIGYAMENGNKELLKVCKKTVKSVEELIDNL